jgi:hypothetical protein
MAALPSGLPESVGDDEDLARFLFSSSQFTSVMAKPGVFLPNPKDRETSVFRQGRERREELWRMGREHGPSERTLYGAAVLSARSVRAALLGVIASEPPAKHAAIVGWAWLDDPDLQKAQQKERALLLAQAAELLLVA